MQPVSDGEATLEICGNVFVYITRAKPCARRGDGKHRLTCASLSCDWESNHCRVFPRSCNILAACFQMVMQAKLERRRRRQSEVADRAESSTPNQDRVQPETTDASRLQRIPPPSEPVHRADVKATAPKAAPNGPALTPVPSHADGAANWYNESGAVEQADSRIPPAAVAEDKAETKTNPAVQKGLQFRCWNTARNLCRSLWW